MKLVFAKDGVKREIETPFALCCKMEDLDRLILELQAARGSMGDANYGWFRIDETHPAADCASGAPRKWTE